MTDAAYQVAETAVATAQPTSLPAAIGLADRAQALMPYAVLALLVLVVIGLLIFVMMSLRARHRREADRRENQQQLDSLRQGLLDEMGQRLRDQAQALQAVEMQLDSRMLSIYNNTQSFVLESFSNLDQKNVQLNDQIGRRVDLNKAAQEEALQRLSLVMDQRLLGNDAKIERMQKTLSDGVLKMQEDNNKKLDEMRKTVDEKLHDTLNKRLGESFATVSERLEKVYAGLGEMRNLAQGVGDLKRVLTNVKSRGSWGEVQLGRLMEDLLTNEQYLINTTVTPTGSERVEYAVILPGQDEDSPILLPIDAKFPQEAYDRLLIAQEEGDKEAAEREQNQLATAIKGQAKTISTKYIAPPYTTDFAIMYLPLEGLYAQVLSTPGLVDGIQRDHRVVIAGPQTLTALLNSLQMGFRTLAIEKRSGEVWKLLSLVKGDFGKFLTILESTQKRLTLASKDIERATSRTRSIQKRLDKVETLSLSEDMWQMDEEIIGLDEGPDGQDMPIDIPESDEE